RNGLPESIAIQAEVLWMSPGWTDAQGEQVPFVKETTTIEVHRRQPDLRKIDFTIELRALDGHVKIGGSEDVKGYGGFSARIRLPKGIRFTGTSGAVTPENTAVQAGPWVDFSGSFIEESVSGITIFTHPSLPNFPPPWILRSEASMQNPVFPGRAPVAVPTESPLTLRYRLVLHAGGPDTINPDSLQAEYSTLVE
ncbi:MAG: PmoA family protein, partial [Candidatus Marinimicrobia bacterium]|nr:PmoA family protein [Candidatus Neomarinimicrobiota bacterium]